MFAIEVQSSFYATHALRLPAGGAEPSHAHLFQVTVRLESAGLDAFETVIDFHIVEELLAQIVRPWRSAELNAIEPFKSVVNPSAERIAEHIGKRFQNALVQHSPGAAPGVVLREVRLTEAANCTAIWLAQR